jgi:hypothetical protein
MCVRMFSCKVNYSYSHIVTDLAAGSSTSVRRESVRFEMRNN